VQVAVIARVSVEAAKLWLVWMIGKGKLSSTSIKETPITSFFSPSRIHTDAMSDESMVLKKKIYSETQQAQLATTYFHFAKFIFFFFDYYY
jgi:hypothetical protein